MRQPIIAGNWKMNTNLSEARALARALRLSIDGIAGVDKVLCPPFISLAAVADAIQGSSLKLGAQNMHSEGKGAFTGEVSPLMLDGLCQFVILGHSERRAYFAESDEFISKKVAAALTARLTPILCVGERLEEKEAGQTETVVRRQLTGALKGVAASQTLVVAYEPVWAIGTGKAATADAANATIGFIRSVLAEVWGRPLAQGIRVQYGGSVTAANAGEILRQPEIDGALVGGASLKAEEFTRIVQEAASLKAK